jgi:hypothetical protein
MHFGFIFTCQTSLPQLILNLAFELIGSRRHLVFVDSQHLVEDRDVFFLLFLDLLVVRNRCLQILATYIAIPSLTS